MMKFAMVLAGLLLAMPQEKADPKRERLVRALQWYADPDPDVRATGRKELLAMGPEAVPKLEELLRAQGNAYELHMILLDISKGIKPGTEMPQPLPTEAELKELAKENATIADKYVRQRMDESYKLAKAGAYQKAYDIATAVLVLEPKSKYAGHLQNVRKHCDNRITQTTLVKSRILGPSGVVKAGAKVDLTLRMENVWKDAIEIKYDKGTAEKPTKALVFIEIICELKNPNGSTTKMNRDAQIEIEHDMPIATGAHWERAFSFDTAIDFPQDDDYLRTYSIAGWTPAVKVDWGIAISQKRVFFEPLTLHVIPAKHSHLAEEPLKKLEKCIAAGSVNEVFICAMILNDSERPKGVERLVALLKTFSDKRDAAKDPEEKKASNNGMSITANILTAVTGQMLGVDAAKWKEYSDTLNKK